MDTATFEFSDFMTRSNEILAETLKFFKKEHLEIKYNCPEQYDEVFINSDRGKLKKVITNLIKNAVKFTHKGYIETGFQVNGSDLTFYVEDSGIGIEKDKHELIFENFRQIEDAHTREYEGIGLGLSICKKIVELLGGKIYVDSEPGIKTRFSVLLRQNIINSKRRKRDHSHVSAASSAKDVLNDKVLLVVEDDKSNMFLIESMLKFTGLKLITAWDGNEAVEIYKSNPDIDLVLMDINLPEISGLEATRKILKINPEVPVIATTAYAYYDDQYKCKEAGCVDFIAKPLNRKVLINKIIENI
jgi:CheY-like chemotaxis protein